MTERLDAYSSTLLSALNSKDTKAVTSTYNTLSSFIAFISVLAGIPPGTTPSASTNAEVARSYRHMITSLSKLGLSNDIARDKTSAFPIMKSRSASVVSGSSLSSSLGSLSNSSKYMMERKFSIASEISENGEVDSFKLGVKETNTLVSTTKAFIRAYRMAQNLMEEDALLNMPNFTRSNSASSLGSPTLNAEDPVFPVKQFRAGTWTDVTITSSGDYTDPVAPTSNVGAVPFKKSFLQLESFDTVIPLDSEAVAVLEHQRSKAITILCQIFVLFDSTSASKTSNSTEAPEKSNKDLRRLVLSNLTSLISLVTNMSNLVESVDLSVFQKHRRKSSSTMYMANAETPTQPIFLLYDFLEAKQALSDDLGTMVAAVQSCNILSENYMDELATALALTSVTRNQCPMPKSPEDREMGESETTIKKRALDLGVTIDSLVHTASALAEEHAAILSFRASDAYNGLGVLEEPSTDNASVDNASVSYGKRAKLVRTHSGSSLTPSSAAVSVKDDAPWYLQPDYPNDVVYDKKRNIRGGTFPALVEQLTYHSSLNASFNAAMMLTFRSFATPQELFHELVRRYGIQPPEGLSVEEFQQWTERKQKLVRLRVVNIMKKWLDEYWYEDCTHKSIQTLLESMLAFADQMKRQNNPGHEIITRLAEAKLRLESPTPRRVVQNSSVPPPPLLLPRNIKKMKILDVDPLELARQLTVREFKLFEKITPFECLTRRQRKTKLKNASIENTCHIDAFIHNSNHLTNWVSYMILKYVETKKRAQAIKYFVSVAEYCRQCNNFSSMMAIISALFSATIHRMKKTWAVVVPKTVETLDNMNRLMNSSRNFNEYRDILRMVTPPMIPFFGVYLSDLTFVEDGNPDYLQDNPTFINFAKRMKAAEIIREIMQYQVQHYVFQDVPAIQQLLDQGFEKAPPIDVQYDQSLILEPRERTTERMAKLLEETGYL